MVRLGEKCGIIKQCIMGYNSDGDVVIIVPNFHDAKSGLVRLTKEQIHCVQSHTMWLCVYIYIYIVIFYIYNYWIGQKVIAFFFFFLIDGLNYSLANPITMYIKYLDIFYLWQDVF